MSGLTLREEGDFYDNVKELLKRKLLERNLKFEIPSPDLLAQARWHNYHIEYMLAEDNGLLSVYTQNLGLQDSRWLSLQHYGVYAGEPASEVGTQITIDAFQIEKRFGDFKYLRTLSPVLADTVLPKYTVAVYNEFSEFEQMPYDAKDEDAAMLIFGKQLDKLLDPIMGIYK